MGKKKLSSSIQDRRKKRANVIPLVSRNRFEVRLNRSKHSIVGKKEKHDRGAPGISRSRANEKRKKTLLTEYKQRNKSNVLIDKRFGEFDDSVSAEEKMLKRFTLEKQSHHVKPGLYNIDDDEELTHFGQSLADISNFEEIELDLSGEEGEDASSKFGGFLTRKKDVQSGDWKGDRKLTRQEVMHEIIADSKKEKFVRQKTKQLAFELTQRIDTEWKEIQSLLVKRSDTKSRPKERQDDYDKTVNELLFEAKGKPSERLKSVEEIEKEERKRLKEMEKQRLIRMQITDEEEVTNYKSADALIEKVPKKIDDRFELRFKDGEMIKSEEFDDMQTHEGEQNEKDNSEDGEDDTDDEDADEDNNSENDNDDSDSGDGNDDDEESSEDNEDVFSDDEDQACEDVKETDSEEENKVDNGHLELDACVNKVSEKKVKKTKNVTNTEIEAKVKVSAKSKKVKKEKFQYNFEVPENLEDFHNIILKSKLDVVTLLDKILKMNSGNKKKLAHMFDILLQYMDDVCNKPKPNIKSISSVTSFIQELVKVIPLHITNIMQLKLKTMFTRITKCIKHKQYSEIFPSLTEFIFLKIIDLVYPTSDLNHAITTPSLFMISFIFTKARFSSMKSILSGIFLVNVVYDYVKLSHRYLPEVITFLAKLLYQAAPVNVPMKKVSSSILNLQKYECNLLVIDNKQDTEPNAISISSLSSSCEVASLETDAFRLSCLRNVLLLSEKFSKLYHNMETFDEIFKPCMCLLERLPVQNYPVSVKSLHGNLLKLMQSKTITEKIPLKLQTRKPIPLTLLEPQFDEVYENTFKKHGSGDKTRDEQDKLKYKVKKEMKGAVREIRKDTRYLAKQQLNEKLEKDQIRKRKVKELQSHLENERREIKEMEKGSKFKKSSNDDE